MPLSPTAAQSATSRANGTLSRGPDHAFGQGPLRPERHPPRPRRPLPPPPRRGPAAAYERLRAALLARHAPADAAEEHWVEELAFAA